MDTMAFYNKSSEKKRIMDEFRCQDEEVKSLCRIASRPVSPRSAQEQEKRIRREIANSNERRRMQSINQGFQYLRSLLPQGDEKLSKASVLTQTAEHIFRLDREKAMLLEQNCQLKRMVLSNAPNSTDSDSDSPFAKRKKIDSVDLPDECLRIPSPPNCDSVEEMRREIQELTYALECEKKTRMHLEAKLKLLESPCNDSDKTCDIALQDHSSYHTTENSRKHKSLDRLPKSLAHSNEIESFHEVPDSTVHIVPEDLSGRRSSSFEMSSSSCVESSLHSSPPFTVKLHVSSPDEAYAHSTSRQNLATIVEAIRHLEGDHMFRDDLPMSPISQSSSSEELHTDSGSSQISDVDHVLTLQHQIIKNAPVSQSRPGVIVSKIS